MNTTTKPRERMTLTEAAAFLAERNKTTMIEVDTRSPFPALKINLDPIVKRWANRISNGMRSGDLAYCRDINNPRGAVLYRERDLIDFARRLFPRQEAFHA